MPLEQSGIAAAMYAALASREFERAADHVAADVRVSNMATGDLYVGQQGFLEFSRGWPVAFPDLRYSGLKVSGTPSGAVAEYTLEGTHTGPLLTPRGHLPPTGMEVQVAFCDVLDIEADRIVEIRSYFDSVTVLRKLGLISGSPLHAPDRRASLDLYAQPVDTNIPQRHKAIVQRFLQDVFNSRRPAAAADTCSPKIVWHGGQLGEAEGLPAYQEVLATLFTAFPDLELQILDTVAEGDRVMVRFSICGTHLGPFQGISPSHKRISGSATNSYRLEEDRIVEEWWQGDLLTRVQLLDAAISNPRWFS